MSTAMYGVIEILMFFGGILGFCWYQLHSLRRSRERDAELRARGIDPADAERGRNEKPSREDVFWNTVAKPRRR
ncbi:MAG: hypothetical protein ACFBWO_09390 [Paracoccaceae bacterium]